MMTVLPNPRAGGAATGGASIAGITAVLGRGTKACIGVVFTTGGGWLPAPGCTVGWVCAPGGAEGFGSAPGCTVGFVCASGGWLVPPPGHPGRPGSHPLAIE